MRTISPWAHISDYLVHSGTACEGLEGVAILEEYGNEAGF